MLRLRQLASRQGVLIGLTVSALASVLTLVGVWLNQQFDVGRGPLRSADPRVVIWASLAAIAVLVPLWLSAALSGETGTTGEDD